MTKFSWSNVSTWPNFHGQMSVHVPNTQTQPQNQLPTAWMDLSICERSLPTSLSKDKWTWQGFWKMARIVSFQVTFMQMHVMEESISVHFNICGSVVLPWLCVCDSCIRMHFCWRVLLQARMRGYVTCNKMPSCTRTGSFIIASHFQVLLGWLLLRVFVY